MNTWNREVIILNSNARVYKRKWYIDLFKVYEKALIEDKDRLAQVTKECLDLINLIESKMEYVNTVQYKDDKENEWKYIQFGKNEYQADLFFIRNVDRIKLIFNVIKKQKPDYTKKRCQIAKGVMTVKDKFEFPKEDVPDIIPVVYEKKKRWKVMKRYIRKTAPSYVIDNCKGLKWRTKFQLKKEGSDLNSWALARHYEVL
jgi:hypothetical protein